VTLGCLYQPYDASHYGAFAPAALGGADWPPSSYSSNTGYMYVCSKDSSSAWKAVPFTKKTKLQPLGNFFQIEGLGPPPGSPKWAGSVVAMNMRDNTRACNDGQLQAYSDTTGKLLWSSPKLHQSVNAPAMTYSVDGKQYIAVYAGGNSIAQGFGGAKIKYGSDLYVFTLP
jgi:quinohemoprotein ethanol dehydrogenase